MLAKSELKTIHALVNDRIARLSAVLATFPEPSKAYIREATREISRLQDIVIKLRNLSEYDR